MSDTEKSGAALDEPTATTPAARGGDKRVSLGGDECASTQHNESTTEQAPQPEVQEQQSDFAFGTSRGSGLARGKRKTATAPDAPTAQASGYEPTAIEVITPKSEYSNPFTGETVVETPRREKAPQVETPQREEPTADLAQPSEEKPAAVEATATSSARPATEAAPKPELKILPPAQPNRNRQSWESPSEHPARRAAAATGENANKASAADAPRSRGPRGSSEGRPTFQPERRSRPPHNEEAVERSPRPEKPHREERPKRDPREPRGARERTDRTERGPRAAASSAKPVPKPQGFFGWLKSLFGGTDSKPGSSRPKPSNGSDPSREGGPKRRSRGGRGRGNSNGARASGEKTVSERPTPSRNSEDQRDRPRNRSRGGRGGRSRTGPRSEGQQSGGAI